MQTHQMKLQLIPFEQVKSGKKTIEIRLNDKKRQLIEVGDIVEFSLLDDLKQTVKTEVIELFHFSTFKELFSAFPPELYGGESADEYKTMYKYYSKEDEKRYGVLGIKVVCKEISPN